MTHPSSHTTMVAVITPIDIHALRGQAEASAITSVGELDGLTTWRARAATDECPSFGWSTPSRRMSK